MMAFTVVGMRVLFAMPLDLRSNWVFRMTPLHGGRECVAARRRAFLVLAVAPVWTVFAVALFWLWPWQGAAGHLAVLGLTGMIMAEFCLQGTQKIPFTCSYLPGKSNFHVTFWMCIGYIFALVAKGAGVEQGALKSSGGTAILLGALLAVWLAARWRTAWMTGSEGEEAQFEDAPADEILTLNLSRNSAG